MTVRVALRVVFAACLFATSAQAQLTKDQCVDANASAQRLRLSGKLRAAHARLLTCADPACPSIVRDDCTRRFDELDRAQPTIILDVKDAADHDVTDVRVTVDGTPLSERLDGASLMVDPGVHVFTIEAVGQPKATRTFVIKEAEKGRRERIVVGTTPTDDERRENVPPTPGQSLGTQRWLGLGLGGGGLVGVAVGSVFGVLADVAWNDQKRACGSPTSCTNAGHAAAVTDHSRLTTDGSVSTAAFIAAGALLAGGALLFFTAPRRTSSSSAGLMFVPSVGPSQATMGIRASF